MEWKVARDMDVHTIASLWLITYSTPAGCRPSEDTSPISSKNKKIQELLTPIAKYKVIAIAPK